jgi:hypothetical protein
MKALLHKGTSTFFWIKNKTALFTLVRLCVLLHAMNSELQAQSDALCKAINAAATGAHQDMLFAVAALGVLLVVLIIVVLFKKP